MNSILVADIGGTKSELAIFRGNDDRQPLYRKRFLNADFSHPVDLIDTFLSECGYRPRVACLAVAGVIDSRRVRMTNLSWELDATEIEQRWKMARVLLINDLTALSHSLELLEGEEELLTLQQGGQDKGVCGIIAPGTGLGEGLLVRIGEQLLARGSEGGHADFAPVDGEQLQLLAWMQQKEMPVSFETLIAGPGMVHLYQFYTQCQKFPQTPAIAEQLAQAEDSTPVIVQGALAAQACPLCLKTVELFLSILGSEAGNLALKLYATGGIYLGGGILPRLAGQISFDGFLRAFRSKGPMSSLMHDFPIYLILRPDAALLGGVMVARNRLGKYL